MFSSGIPVFIEHLYGCVTCFGVFHIQKFMEKTNEAGCSSWYIDQHAEDTMSQAVQPNGETVKHNSMKVWVKLYYFCHSIYYAYCIFK